MSQRINGLKEGLITLQERQSTVNTESKLKNTIFIMVKENQDLKKEIRNKEAIIKQKDLEIQ